MRRLIALTAAVALALPLIIGFGPTPARADNDTATNVALGLAAFAVFNQLMGPYVAPPPVRVVYRPVPVYREVSVYRKGHGYKKVPAYPSGYPHGYKKVVPYPHGQYELRGDGHHHGHRWVWIPSGRHAAPPVPPLPPPPFRR